MQGVEVQVDSEALFQSSSEYLMLTQSLTVLEQQLAQAHRDIDTLCQLKAEALSDPESLVEMLRSAHECSKRFPPMQTIYRVPELDVSRFHKRTSRRGSSKHEQNLEFLLAKVSELQRTRSGMLPPLLSTSIPIASATPLAAEKNKTGIAQVRERFHEIAGRTMPRAMSVPALSTEELHPAGTEARTASPGVMSKRSNRVPIHDATPIAAHYNLPWSEEEKRRMNELLLIYPEEEVISRRYAKIAAALGTRTSSQVANRINKLATKRQRVGRVRTLLGTKSETTSGRASGVASGRTSGNSTPNKRRRPTPNQRTKGSKDDIPEEMKDTPEYQEYLKLKSRLEMLEQPNGTWHDTR